MAINSVNTNPSSLTALRSVNSANSASSNTQNRISTGQQVSNALDSASLFAIAQGLRAELQASNAVSQGLNQTSGTVSVATAGATALSNLGGDIQAKLVQLADPTNSASQTELLRNDLNSLLEQAGQFVSESSFNGQNLLESGATDQSALANVNGDTVTISAQSGVGDAVATLQAAVSAGGDPTTILQNEFASFQTAVGGALGSLGADQRQIQQQNDFLQTIADTQTEGLGNIVDADLARESARLTAQNVQAQLAQQAFGIANQQPNSLLGLFR